MEKCEFLSINFVSAKRTRNEQWKKQSKTEKSSKVFVTIKKANGKICKFQIADDVKKYFHKLWVSKSLVDSFEKKVRIGEIIFGIDHGRLIIM